MIEPRSFAVVLPELEIAASGLVLLLAAAVGGRRATRFLGWLAIAAFVAAGAALFSPERLAFIKGGLLPAYAFKGMFVDDAFARFAKAVVLAASGLSILLSWTYFEKEGQDRPECPVLIAFAALGMMLMISASDLIALYVGIELQSLPLYILAAFNRTDSKSSEAGLKYFVLGAMSSGIMLYGLSLLYGFAGATDFASLGAALSGDEPVSSGAAIGMLFVCAGLAFKIGGAPFHMWAPDVYEGAPTPVTAFFATGPKLAAFALLVRFMLGPMGSLMEQGGREAVLFVCVASMLWGAYAGLAQTNVKRMLAYSSILNAGTMLIGVVVGGTGGVQALLIYFTIYALATLAAFAILLCLRRGGKAAENLGDLSGLSRTHPLAALAMAAAMFSLAGVPPLAGFFGKYFIFLAAVQGGFVPLALVGVLASVVAAFYYLRVIKVMYADEPVAPLDPLPDWSVRLVAGLAAVGVCGLAFAPTYLVDGAIRAAKGLIV